LKKSRIVGLEVKTSFMSKDFIRDSFRRWGYLQADLDAFSRLEPFAHPEIDDVTEAEAAPWREKYCGHIGAEFMHMPFPERCEWVAKRLEGTPEESDQHFTFKRILEAELFEKFIHTRYVGNKRFSLDGLAALIPLLDNILEKAAEHGFEIVMIGMSHRGRLNTMVHIVGIAPSRAFAGFEDIDPRSVLGGGDVKYHKGATGTYSTQLGFDLSVHLASNPSHLEAINPVLLGRVRARQQRLHDGLYSKVLPIIIHGDAAFAGQGIAAETLNFMDLPGFSVGGTVNIIVNNLIGFTATPSALHSSRFSTDIAKRLPIPIFHVNAEQPDDVVRVGKLAMDYRAQFKTDVVVDLIGYRRYGHSEIDDPTLTLPLLYKKIKNYPLLYQSYGRAIGLTDEEVQRYEYDTITALDAELEKARAMTSVPPMSTLPEYWDNYQGGFHEASMEVDTAVTDEEIEQVAKSITTFPEDFHLHPKLKKGFGERLKMGLGEKPIDWAMAEQLAIGTLLWDGINVRLSGQDSRRGTFSHRHAAIYDTENGEAYIPLGNLRLEQGQFDVYDSMLSEAAAVGFEYGFSRDFPETLVCWEAQFGDFTNGAQIIIDQFITAGEDKWHLLCGLVMLLPHGYEGQGPEHSSARLERFLQVCGEDNIQVTYPSTASQYFHLLRRQVLRTWRKPLIVFTPKSTLRSPAAASPRELFTSGRFELALDDLERPEDAKRLLLCSGKIVHELRKERKKRDIKNVAVATIEQLYPFPEEELKALIQSYTSLTSIIWVQEEPSNMGPLYFVRPFLERLSGGVKVTTVRRSVSASPATGSPKAHALEQDAIIKLAFANVE